MLVADPGHQADHASYGDDVRLDGGDLRADVAVQADEFEVRLVEYPGDGVLRGAVGDRQAELLVVGAGADLGVSAGGDAGHDAHHDLLAGVGGGDRGEPGDLGGAVDDDASDAEPDGGAQVFGALGVAVHHDVLGREAGGDGERQLACGADVQAQAFFLYPVRECTAQERLGGVDDVGFGERRAVGAAALADLLFVQYVDGGAEAVGCLGEGDPADGDVAVGLGAGGAGPDGQAVGVAEDPGQGLGIRGQRGRKGRGKGNGHGGRLLSRSAGSDTRRRQRRRSLAGHRPAGDASGARSSRAHGPRPRCGRSRGRRTAGRR